MKTFHVQPVDKGLAPALQAKIDNLNKPLGSLGRLESLALQIGLIQQTLSPQLLRPQHVLLAGDHGIEREGVSRSPREVTWQQVENFARGGGGVNMFCRQHGFGLHLVDVGVDHSFDSSLGILDRKIAPGTGNFLREPAMTQEQMEQALDVGAEMAEACHNEGSNVLSLGEMGIGNTSASSVWMHCFLSIPLDKCVGAGSGLDSEGVRHKFDVLRHAVETFVHATGIELIAPFEAPAGWREQRILPERPFFPAYAEEVVRWFGGFEMVAAVGAMLRAAQLRMLVIVDGFIMSACLLAAYQLCPAVRDYAVFGHVGDEQGHALMLRAMGAQPLLNLGLRLGEGTGALCAWPLIVSAVNMLNEMDNFAHAGITKYF